MSFISFSEMVESEGAEFSDRAKFVFMGSLTRSPCVGRRLIGYERETYVKKSKKMMRKGFIWTAKERNEDQLTVDPIWSLIEVYRFSLTSDEFEVILLSTSFHQCSATPRSE